MVAGSRVAGERVAAVTDSKLDGRRGKNKFRSQIMLAGGEKNKKDSILPCHRAAASNHCQKSGFSRREEASAVRTIAMIFRGLLFIPLCLLFATPNKVSI